MTPRRNAARPLVVIGSGAVGRALEHAARLHGVRTELRKGRGRSVRPIPDGALVVIAVREQSIAAVSAQIARAIRASHVVVHTAGARDASLLADCEVRGAQVGVLHPLIAFDRVGLTPLDGAYFVAASRDRRAVAAMKELARRIHAHVVVQSTGPRHHARAAFVANGSAALLLTAVTDWGREARVPKRLAGAAFGRLLRSVAERAERDPALALTGPVRRGDIATVRAHRDAIEGELADAYDRVLPLIVNAAVGVGLDTRSASEMIALTRTSATRRRGRARTRAKRRRRRERGRR